MNAARNVDMKLITSWHDILVQMKFQDIVNCSGETALGKTPGNFQNSADINSNSAFWALRQN